MKNLICALMLSCVAAASAAGGDSGDRLRDRREFCRQFVIEDPGGAVLPSPNPRCCRVGHWISDCYFGDFEERACCCADTDVKCMQT